eukprot:4997340-Amphidinium_carterae.1
MSQFNSQHPTFFSNQAKTQSIWSALAMPEDWPYATWCRFSRHHVPVAAGRPGSHSAGGCRFSRHHSL